MKTDEDIAKENAELAEAFRRISYKVRWWATGANQPKRTEDAVDLIIDNLYRIEEILDDIKSRAEDW